MELLEKKMKYFSVCAEKNSFLEVITKLSIINYDLVFHISTNIGEGGLDLHSGLFTAGISGTYSVSWNTRRKGGKTDNRISLKKNGEGVRDLLGRAVMISLMKGDKLELSGTGEEYYNMEVIDVCISLDHIDVDFMDTYIIDTDKTELNGNASQGSILTISLTESLKSLQARLLSKLIKLTEDIVITVEEDP